MRAPVCVCGGGDRWFLNETSQNERSGEAVRQVRQVRQVSESGESGE